jgi:hypothetical protein
VRTKISIVSLQAYPLFNPAASGGFGGAEVRAYLMGNTLAKYPEYQLSFVVLDHKQPRCETFNNIDVYPHPAFVAPHLRPHSFISQIQQDIFEEGIARRAKTFPYFAIRNKRVATLLKLLIWIAASIIIKAINKLNLLSAARKIFIEDYAMGEKYFSIYEEIDADIYCVFGVSGLTAQVAAYCKHTGKKLILFIASEYDINPLYKSNSKIKNVYGNPAFLCHYALTQADVVIAQTHVQAQKLKGLFDRDAIIITNPVDLENFLPDTPAYSQRQTALWIGRADRSVKLPLLLIQLAHACPDIQFEMIMNPEDPTVETEVYQSCPPNVIIHPHVPFKEVESFYSRAFVFINTSEFEGFPNTFLQAAKYGVPILSYKVDPDGFIEQYQAGIVAHGNFDKLVEGLYSIQSDQKQDMLFSSNIVHYVKQHHNLDEKVLQLHTILQQMVN